MKKIYSSLMFFLIYATTVCCSQEIRHQEEGFGVLATSFGAVPNDDKDDTDALSKALDYCNQNSKDLFLPSGTYILSKTLVKPQSFNCPSIIGENKSTVIKYTSIRNAPAIKIIGGSGRPANSTISHITFIGNETSTAIEIAGQNKMEINNCLFYDNQIGVLFHNESSNSFTEYCVINRSSFDKKCLTAYEYKRTNGNDSFNGSGGKDLMVNSNSNYAIKIGSGCVVYNAPLDGQFWTWKDGQSLIKHLGSPKSNVYGNLTIEAINKDLILIKPNEIELNHVGNILASTQIKLGALIEAYDVNITGPEAGNVIRVGRKPRQYNVKLKPGKNIITSIGSKHNFLGETVIANVVIRGSLYEDRALLAINHNGYGQNGTLSKISQGFEMNKKGNAAVPKYSIDNKGNFIIEIPSNVSADTNAYVTINYQTPAFSVN